MEAPMDDRAIIKGFSVMSVAFVAAGLYGLAVGAELLFPLREPVWFSKAGALALGFCALGVGVYTGFLTVKLALARSMGNGPPSAEFPGVRTRCPGCGENQLVFVQPYDRYFCYGCHRFAPRGYRAVVSPASSG